MKKNANRIGPFIVVEGDVDGATRCWVEKGGLRVSGYCDIDDAREYANLLYDEYMADADVNNGD